MSKQDDLTGMLATNNSMVDEVEQMFTEQGDGGDSAVLEEGTLSPTHVGVPHLDCSGDLEPGEEDIASLAQGSRRSMRKTAGQHSNPFKLPQSIIK